MFELSKTETHILKINLFNAALVQPAKRAGASYGVSRVRQLIYLELTEYKSTDQPFRCKQVLKKTKKEWL